jgi:hypothetical protein
MDCEIVAQPLVCSTARYWNIDQPPGKADLRPRLVEGLGRENSLRRRCCPSLCTLPPADRRIADACGLPCLQSNATPRFAPGAVPCSTHSSSGVTLSNTFGPSPPPQCPIPGAPIPVLVLEHDVLVLIPDIGRRVGAQSLNRPTELGAGQQRARYECPAAAPVIQMALVTRLLGLTPSCRQCCPPSARPIQIQKETDASPGRSRGCFTRACAKSEFSTEIPKPPPHHKVVNPWKP